MAQCIMVMGTASNAGKSVLCTALCRILAERGYDVAPFKSQNMSLNSAVTPSGREIGRAQAAQAEACGLIPNEHMNPILLKPTSSFGSQIVVQGKVYGHASAEAYFGRQTDALWPYVVNSYQYLAQRHDVIVIEGAGSPVEMNLKARDISNMRTAELADASVLLAADIDRGGVFASVVGTLELLEPSERARVKGIVINRFRGDPAQFTDGVRLLEQYTHVPVIGVVPYIHDIGIDEEDGVALSGARYRQAPSASGNCVRIAVIEPPHIANFTDLDPLFLEPDVHVVFCTRPEQLAGADAVILPGTKNTMDDLVWLHDTKLADAVQRAVADGAAIVGICGGYQMLGSSVRDPHHTESRRDESRGIGLFSCTTTMSPTKRTLLVEGTLCGTYAGIPVHGYEIHMGETDGLETAAFASTRPEQSVHAAAGSQSEDGRIIGTYLHGIFHNDDFRTAWLNRLRNRKGMDSRPALHVAAVRMAAYDRLAHVVEQSLDIAAIERMIANKA